MNTTDDSHARRRLVAWIIAGIALLGALGGALTAAVEDPSEREPAVVALVVSPSGVVAGGISAPFFGLLAGLAVRAVLRWAR